MNRIQKNDTIYVISGKDRGKKGRVLKVFPQQNFAIVEGINLGKKHMRQRRQDRPGGIIERENPIDLSNIMPYCTNCRKPVRVNYKELEDGSKIRMCNKCKEVI